MLLMFVAGVGVFAWSIIEHSDEIRTGGLAALGGILLLLTAYFTARNLQISASTAFNEQLMRASELLCERDPVKQMAARKTLLRMKRRIRARADEEAIDAILQQRSRSDRRRTTGVAAATYGHRTRP